MASKLSVLVIDDEEDVRSTLYDNLSEWGFDVTLAEDGEKGLAYINSDKPPQVVITDIVMPGEEGIGIIRKIRNQELDIKVIAISGNNLESYNADFLKMAEKLGADAIFQKPINMNQLEETLVSFSDD